MIGVEEIAISKARKLLPGLTLVFVVAAAATFLSEHYHAPATLFALLLGMAFNSTAAGTSLAPGLHFATKTLLRVGVALLGMRVSIGEMTSIGIQPLVMVAISIPATILFGWFLGRFWGADKSFGLLTGSAVAICGASAALAVSAVLPKSKNLERDTGFTVMAVTALSTMAMIGYPMLFARLGLDPSHQGILIGGTIHDVAQVVGAGFAVSNAAGVLATYVKLFRVAMLPLVVLTFSLTNRESSIGKWWKSIPWFAAVFAALLALKSLGLIPTFAAEAGVEISKWFLLAAIAGLGAKTSLSEFGNLGLRLTSIVVLETLFLLAFDLGAMQLF